MNQFAEFVTRYATQTLDTSLVLDSVTDVFRQRNAARYYGIDFNNYGEVVLPKIQVGGLGDYHRVNTSTLEDGYANFGGYAQQGGDGYPIQDVSSSFEHFRLQWDRAAQYRIDDVDDIEQARILSANVLSEAIRTRVVPEQDACYLGYIADRANVSLGNVDTGSIAADGGANDIYAKLTNAFSWLTNLGVREQDQVIFVSASTFALMQLSSKISRFILADNQTIGNYSFKVYSYNGHRIVVAPDDRFFTNVQTVKDGYRASTDSKSINFMVVDASSVMVFERIRRIKAFTLEADQNGDSYKIDMHFWHGIWVPDNKVPGIYVSLGSNLNATATPTVYVSTVAGSVANSFRVTNSFVTPTSLFRVGICYDTDDEYELGDVISNPKFVTLNTDITVDASKNTAWFYAVNGRGEVVAKTQKAVALSKKA